jgi:hypothetical protein
MARAGDGVSIRPGAMALTRMGAYLLCEEEGAGDIRG